ncbi:hypothetical protein CCR97_08260 [Rhodoplanes elegans]|uniref:Uncharacterized protein n=1 Tax=Rhodoplanes elegans TaxID=29408 RepID=A0A327KV80_9BRAD|nr:hypothetical protein [Rhodoplanes elegans]MBK5958204.1 hypothetical protein [Rhodoplanes elegans]RAI41986.1 hypothetical protein CH338_01400 [Rhodoplanes elegans]
MAPARQSSAGHVGGDKLEIIVERLAPVGAQEQVERLIDAAAARAKRVLDRDPEIDVGDHQPAGRCALHGCSHSGLHLRSTLDVLMSDRAR